MRQSAATTERIREQEKKDFFIVSRWLNDNAKNLVWIKQTEFGEPWDCTLRCLSSNNLIEIKSRQRSADNLAQFPFANLNVYKYNLIENQSDNGDNLWLFHILNESKLYIYNITHIDDIEGVSVNLDWNTNKTQYDETRGTSKYDCYDIPYSSAYRVADVTEYYKQYYNENATYF